MKKSLLIGLLLLGSFALVGCQKSDGEGEQSRFTVAEGYCENEGGVVEFWEEGDEYQPVCFYEEDESYCYFEDLYDGLCSKGEFYYFEEYDLYPYAEQACIDSDGQISETEDGDHICIFNDDEFCYMDDIIDGGCDLLYPDYVVCTEEYDPVCGVDGNTYGNRCFLEAAGVEEETELAEIVDGECVFG